MLAVVPQALNKLESSSKRFWECWWRGSRRSHHSRVFAKIALISAAFLFFLLLHFASFCGLQYVRDPTTVTSFLNSTYFAIITYGTIGFGDVTPQSMDFTQAMEVLRVLVFASSGLALVGLCFTLYREAAQSNMGVVARAGARNMKVITKKMSVLPHRISSVQKDFIDSLQRSRSLPTSAWSRVSVQNVINSNKHNHNTGPWSRVSAREVVARAGARDVLARGKENCGACLQDIAESVPGSSTNSEIQHTLESNLTIATSQS